jgi:recombinational DNA repair protein (RecF pathway)
MAERISSDGAEVLMNNAGLEPLVPFKNNTTPWLSKCLVCGLESTPTLKSIKNRSSKRKGCRHCAPNAPKSEEQATQIMRERNLEPLEPYINSTTKWKCKCLVCSSIVTPAYNSIKAGQGGCLKCAGMLVNPEEAKEFFIKNDLEPLVSYPGAGKPWKSRHTICGREVEPTYSNVRSGHSGCKFCIGNIVDEDKARKVFIARGLLPIEPYRNALATWKSIHQECGQVVNPRYNGVQQGQGGCRSCAGNKPLSENDAVELFKARGLEPLEPYPGSQLRWKSKHLKCGRIVFPRYVSIQQGQGGCGYCAGNVIDVNDAIKLLREKGLEPIENYVNSSTPWRSIHVNCGREVAPAYNSIQQGQSGCGHCAGNIVDAEEAKKLFIKRGLIPQENFPGANKPWRSIHAQCGREVLIKYAYVLDGSSGCRECAVNYVNPELALEIFRTANLEPLEPYPGAHRGWRAIHTVCGREVSPHWGYVRKYLAGCKYCAGKALTEGDAKKILEDRGFKPVEPYPGSQMPWRMLHLKCGMEVSPRLNSLRYASGGGDGCRNCADSTFNYSEPAIIYLMTNSILFAHKIGISGQKKNRVQQHRREGWETFKTLDFETGERAYDIEQEVLSWLSESFGWTPYLTKSDMPQGGYTETIDASEIDLATIWAKVEELSKVKG